MKRFCSCFLLNVFLVLLPSEHRGIHHLRALTLTLRLTDAGVPPEDVPVEDVEGEMAEAAWDLAVKVLTVEWAAVKKGKQRYTFTISQNGRGEVIY